MTPRPRRPTDADYERLLAFRTGLRRFLHWSEQQAAAAGLTPAHHQLMLAIRGHTNPEGPTIADVADALLLRHHSAVELATRAEQHDLVERRADHDDGRVTRLALTRKGHRHLDRLSAAHLEELRRLKPRMDELWKGLDEAYE
jgi:DNA-binding MarR family transcriptional regulator